MWEVPSSKVISNLVIFTLLPRLLLPPLRLLSINKLIPIGYLLGSISHVKDWKARISLWLKGSQNLVAFIIKGWEFVTGKLVKTMFGEGEAQKYVTPIPTLNSRRPKLFMNFDLHFSSSKHHQILSSLLIVFLIHTQISSISFLSQNLTLLFKALGNHIREDLFLWLLLETRRASKL